MKHLFFVLSLICALSVGMAQDSKNKKANAKAAAAGPGSSEFSGKVVETMNAASYTYVLVDTGGKKLWAAAPRFNVKVGDTVGVSDSMPMQNYQSKTLNRTFDTVHFTGAVTVNGVPAGRSPAGGAASGGALPAGHPPIGGGSTQPPMGSLPAGHPQIGAEAAKTVDIKNLKRAEGGSTVAEIYASAAKLNGKKVAVRGKVVKFNSMIMDRNWIHIQDGTGKAGSNDLLVTSKTAARVGDVVLVTGVISTNKDFGAGYKYSVIMENAEVVVE